MFKPSLSTCARTLQGFALVFALAACSASKEPGQSATATPAPASTAPAQLPFGGRIILPGHRVVAYYGAAGVPNMGILGTGAPANIAPRLLRQAHAYDSYGQKVVPALELIATVAQSVPGAYGRYSASTDDETIARYLRSVRAFHGLLILDIQPGRAAFLPNVQRYERFLREPDVSVALDSEWSMKADEVPAQAIGGTSGAVVNGVATYLSTLIHRYDLPQKLLIIHQFTPLMIEGRDSIRPHRGVAIVFHIDGFGGHAAKVSKYDALSKNRNGAFMGFKLFYHQDVDMFSAREVMNLRPRPDLITYQ